MRTTLQNGTLINIGLLCDILILPSERTYFMDDHLWTDIRSIKWLFYKLQNHLYASKLIWYEKCSLTFEPIDAMYNVQAKYII